MAVLNVIQTVGHNGCKYKDEFPWARKEIPGSSIGNGPPMLLSDFIIKRKEKDFFSDYKNQGKGIKMLNLVYVFFA